LRARLLGEGDFQEGTFKMYGVKSILLVGVGGQGTILVAKILSSGLMEAGYDVKMSEVHGMAQRGGSVSSQVRYGAKVFSPFIDKGQADILVSFERMEALRWLECLRPGGKVIVNDCAIPSASTLLGRQVYPTGVLETLKEKADTTTLDATRIASDLGNPKAMNIVLLGTMAKAMGLLGIDWAKEIARNVKPAFLDLNIRAFAAGLAA
jgi:indolepyruvate ferredoxin oxidoreductase beta subunit